MSNKNKVLLHSNWLVARSTQVQWTGVELTTNKPPSSNVSPWMPAVVPGTVLTTLLRNKLIPDPFYGLENENIIDIADSGREYYTFWFFTQIDISLGKQEHAWLLFRGINYHADVFLNGHKKELPKGMFQRHLLDVSDWITSKGPNYLAVLVHPPDHPGRIPPQGGQGGDHEIAKDVAAQYVEGWDWMAPIRDRNTGIWDEVSLHITGPVKLNDPHLVSSFFDNMERAYLHVSTEVVNRGPATMSCILTLQVEMEPMKSKTSTKCVSRQDLVIPGNSTVVFTFPPMLFDKPELWWPNGMGNQTLHKVDLGIEVQNYGQSDSWTHHFGFRKIESQIDPSTGGRIFSVNEEPLFIRGGNWIVSDGLLRLSEERYKSDIDFHADMNFNMIRCWGGGIAERPEFYALCDQRGLLVWQEFWITGDDDGRGINPPSNPNWPLDHELFLSCAKDTIKLLRNYASLALWVGGNEQHPADDINKALKEALQLHPNFNSYKLSLQGNEYVNESPDPSQYLDGTRIYIQGSLWDGFARGDGQFADGPYTIQNPEDFFKDSFYAYGFNPEIGSVGVPVAATMKATMPPDAWQIPLFVKQSDGYIAEVPNPTWYYHKYMPYSNPGKVHDQIEMYGEPTDLDDFCDKAQLVNYVQYRAVMEGWTSRMWTKYTGVLIWKNQNPWVGLRGQFYDHLHEQTGGFFGVRCACEPIHVQLNLDTYIIEVVNTTASALNNVVVEARVWRLDGSRPYNDHVQGINVPPKSTLAAFEMTYPKADDAQGPYFLLLRLTDSSRKSIISRNFYWLHLAGGDYKSLQDFKAEKATVELTMTAEWEGMTCRLLLEVENTSRGAVRTEERTRVNGEQTKLSRLFSQFCSCLKSRGQVESRGDPLPGMVARLCPCLAANKASHGSSAADRVVVAFWMRLSVLSGGKDEATRILPVTYSQNYFSLVPGEKLNIDVSFEAPKGSQPVLMLSGWNVEPAKYAIQMPL